jgi:hypothetical protein
MVRTKYDRSIQFAQLQTYAWQAKGGHLGPGLPNDSTLDTRIRSAIDSTMQAKGFRAVSEKDADLVLRYEASAEKKVDSDIRNPMVGEFMDLTHTLGTLKLSMIRRLSTVPQDPPVAWEGWVETNIDNTQPLEERDAKLREAVQTLLGKFPPK